jgi:CubicO group peptidase (beta-lactamase class C family)
MSKIIAAVMGTLLVAATASQVLAQPLPSAAPESVGMSSQRLQNIDAFFNREIAQNRVPGAVVAIARDGKLIYFKAFGYADKEKNLPATTDMIFQLASMTKIMATVGALTLTEQGRLPLQAKLSQYFPAFAEMKVGVPSPDGKITTVPMKREILIHDLFRHTSGLTYGGRPDGSSPIAALYPSGGAASYIGTSRDLVNTLVKLPLVHQPGSVFEYSLSMDVLGAVVEDVTQKSLGEHLSQVLWQPLKMTDTSFVVPSDKRNRIARPLAINPINGKPQSIASLDRQTTFNCAGSCAFGSMGDYIRFGQMLVNGGSLEGVQILSPSTVALMTSNHLGPEIVNRVGNIEPHRQGYGFGLGVAVRTQAGLAAVPGNVGEYSWNGANGTGFFADPKAGLVVAYGTAAPGEIRKYYREQVQDLVYGAMTR